MLPHMYLTLVISLLMVQSSRPDSVIAYQTISVTFDVDFVDPADRCTRCVYVSIFAHANRTLCIPTGRWKYLAGLVSGL